MADAMKTPAASGPALGSEDVNALVRAASEAATDQMVERLAATLERTVGALEVLTQPEKVAAIEAVAEKAARLEDSGALDTLIDLAQVITAAGEAATDQMVGRLSALTEALLSVAATPGVPELATAAAASAAAAAEETAKAEIRVGVIGLLALLRDPETRRGLEFLLRFAKHLERGISAS